MKRFYSILILLFLSLTTCFAQWQCKYVPADPMYDQEASYFFAYADASCDASFGFYDLNCSLTSVALNCPHIIDYDVQDGVRWVVVRLGFYENNELIEKFDFPTVVSNNDGHILLFVNDDAIIIKNWLLNRGSIRVIVPQFLENSLDVIIPKYNGKTPRGVQ